MLDNKNGLLSEPKYRICKTPDSNGKKIVFFCDWDCIHSPKSTFLGKPVYFQQSKNTKLPFRSKEIEGEIYQDLLKIGPQCLYTCDMGLKLICENLAPELLVNDNKSILQTLCFVPTKYVIREVGSILASQELCRKNNKFKIILEKIKNYLGDAYQLGVVGYHALNPIIDECDLDLVIIADTVEQLNFGKEKIDCLPKLLHSTYISNIWPLSKRTTDLGSLDFFYSPRNAPSDILSNLENAQILKLHFEFESIIVDDLMGILGTPIWKTKDDFYIVGIDNALRGRLRIGERVAGIGIFAMIENKKLIIVQSIKNICNF